MSGIRLVDVNANGVPAEWVLTEGADPGRRLLYIHGGAFIVGSPRSHRAITTTLSRITNASVLAIDYRLAPENSRVACIEDCQAAYKWVLDNGPDDQVGAPDAFFIAGDSAGGNLTLMTIAWARDKGLTEMPQMMRAWTSLIVNRVKPNDPRISPVFGDLSDLPPTLVHASEAEVLFDDARRWVNKAQDAGTKATLQTWPHVLHVWHIFGEEMPEAKEAFENIRRFIRRYEPDASVI